MQGNGLFTSVKTMLSTLLGMVHTRLALLANELEEDRLRLIKLMFYSLLLLFFFCLGVVLLTLLIIAVFWDTHRLLALGLATATCLCIASSLAVCVMCQIRRKPMLFYISLTELAKDIAAMESAE